MPSAALCRPAQGGHCLHADLRSEAEAEELVGELGGWESGCLELEQQCETRSPHPVLPLLTSVSSVPRTKCLPTSQALEL